jgi:hypothetical protein
MRAFATIDPGQRWRLALTRPLLAGALLACVLLGAGLSEGIASEPATLVQQGPKLTGGPEEMGAGRFGRSVALSADGDTAIVGAPRDNGEGPGEGEGEGGAVWVFTRSGATWTRQARLTAGEEQGTVRFGRSVALAADGDTALVGGPNDNGVGAVWVFTRTGTTWTQQAKLTGSEESGSGWFGSSVALAGDGDTALVGGFVDHSDTGAAWVFARSGSTWTQQGPKLTGGEESGEGEFGWSVALSGDGGTALVGGRGDAGGLGAAWVFARAGAAWAQLGEKLTGGGESGAGQFGDSVALSGDGGTALVGGRADAGGLGAAWVFARAGAAWAQLGEKLTGGGESGAGEFGESVAFSGDGGTALVGGRADAGGLGAAWVFARAGAAWAQQGEKLTGGEERGRGQLGWSAALSADGTTALLGGIYDAAKVGAAWVFAPAPPGDGGGAPGGDGSDGGGSGPAPGGTQPSTGSPSQSATAGGSQAMLETPRQGVAAFKAVARGVVLVSRRIPVAYGVATVTLRCSAPAACRGALRLTVKALARAAGGSRRTLALGAAALRIGSGRTVRVRVALNRAGRLRLGARRPRMKASLAIRVAAPVPVGTRAYAIELVRSRR